MSYRIITDSCCDFPEKMYEELGLSYVRLTVNYDGKAYNQYTESWLQEMYAGLRKGATTQTSAVNPEGWKAVIEPIVHGGEDALVLAFSSGLSTTYQSAYIAARS